MTNVLLSIKPQYVEKILAGSKQWEFRRRIWKKQVDWVYIYASAPVKHVVARFKVKSIIHCDAFNAYYNFMSLWDDTKESAGITYKEFENYFIFANEGYAVQITNLEVFKVHVSLKWFLFGGSVPQNFRYLTPHEKYVLQWCSQDTSASILKLMMELGEDIFFEKLQTMGVLKVE